MMLRPLWTWQRWMAARATPKVNLRIALRERLRAIGTMNSRWQLSDRAPGRWRSCRAMAWILPVQPYSSRQPLDHRLQDMLVAVASSDDPYRRHQDMVADMQTVDLDDQQDRAPRGPEAESRPSSSVRDSATKRREHRPDRSRCRSPPTPSRFALGQAVRRAGHLRVDERSAPYRFHSLHSRTGRRRKMHRAIAVKSCAMAQPDSCGGAISERSPLLRNSDAWRACHPRRDWSSITSSFLHFL